MITLVRSYKCQITNFILNLKIELLKFRIFFLHAQKTKLLVSLKFIIFICLKNKNIYFWIKIDANY